jgi:IgA Peptidase M64/FG-GAP-like repeat
MPDSVTQILNSGPPGTKFNIAVLGDGFAQADQTEYNNLVQSVLLDGVFGRDYFYEDRQAFNIYRVNLISAQSGVSTKQYDEHGTPDDASDDTVISTTIRNTALGYIFSGSWAHCWLEGGANTSAKVNAALSTWVPDYNLVVIILNTTGFGGCGGGGFQIVTKGVGWDVLAHEFGHGTGGLADEYCTSRSYSGGEPGAKNVTVNTNRATLKWRAFVNPSTPVPTGTGSCAGYTAGAKPPGWNDTLDAGLFEGGGTNGTGMYRPVINCRMRGNSPEYCPICYTEMKNKADAKAARTFLKVYAGDFSGDGKDDVLIHNNNSISIYRSSGAALDIVFNAVGMVPGSWQFAPDDRFYVGDFNGDGKAEVVVYNSTNWVTPYLGLLVSDGANGLRLIARYDGSMPNWQFNKNDQFFVADFDGDGKKDLFVFNGSDWSMPYLAMLRSNGTGFSVIQRYDKNLPGWQMAKNDVYVVGDFDGDKKSDLFVFNGTDWSVRYLGMLRSTGNAIGLIKRFDNTLPNWQMAKNDRYYCGDFDGDGKADLFVFNGTDWNPAYLAMLRSTGTDLAYVRRYDGSIPGWQMRKNDRHWVCDVNADGRADLFIYNSDDWGPEYLGVLASNGTSLTGSWSSDWVGEWNLGKVDIFEPCNYEGVGGKRDLVVHNTNWLGMIRATPGLQLQKIYYRYIHNYRYGRNW